MGVYEQERSYAISIHALLAESDPVKIKPVLISTKISIHALLAESDAVSTVP